VNSLQFLTEHGAVAGPVLAVLMVAESVPVIGFFVPGVLILPAIGALSASGVWPFWTMYAWAFLGAVLGDILGYSLGRTGVDEWSRRLIYRRHRRAVDIARKLVEEHGALAIILGRFAWIIHPAIPPAVGFLGVKPRSFLLIDMPAVGLWALLYMGLGHLATGIWINKTFELVEIVSLLFILLAIFYIARRTSDQWHHRE
jgi:membrane protein DedA with SNARE-associated domain